jgi:hypothetical protein
MYKTLLEQLKKLVNVVDEIDYQTEALQDEIDTYEDQEDEDYIDELKVTIINLEETKGHIEEAIWYLRRILKIKKGETK